MLIASLTACAACLVVALGYQLGRNPGILDRPSWPAGMRFTAPEMTAVAAMVRFQGWLVLIGGIFAAIALTAIGN